MNRRIAALGFVLGIIAGLFAAVNSPVQASPAPAPSISSVAPLTAPIVIKKDNSCTLGIYCGRVWHYSPDDGYDPPFLISCNYNGSSYGQVAYLHEGGASTSICPDVDGIYVNAGAQIRCSDGGGGWVTYWNATGWHRITNLQGGVCVYFVD